MTTPLNPYRGFRYPAEVIQHAVWLYHCFSLSLRDVELILAACGIPGAVFVHRSGHLAIATTREAALAMAQACLARRPSPAEALRRAWGR